jgi:hypothetical protein
MAHVIDALARPIILSTSNAHWVSLVVALGDVPTAGCQSSDSSSPITVAGEEPVSGFGVKWKGWLETLRKRWG